jgi:serine/threonine protein kinase
MDASAREMIYLLRAFLEMCILLPGIPPQHHHHHHTETLQQSEEVRLAAWECTEEAFMQQIKQRDPLGMGMPDIWALRLVRRLLQWYPQDRISAAEALQHPFFHPSLQDDPRKL